MKRPLPAGARPAAAHLPHALLADAFYREHLLPDGRQLHAAGGTAALAPATGGPAAGGAGCRKAVGGGGLPRAAVAAAVTR